MKKADQHTSSLEERLQSPYYLPSREDMKRLSTFFGFQSREHAFASIDQVEFDTKLALNNGFEVLTKEYISALAAYIVSRDGNRILELGAGGGRLAYFLSKELEVQAPGRFEYHAVDNGDWNLNDPYGIVEVVDFRIALKDYKPDLVLVSWMPPDVDWTKAIRRVASVKEYILIGEDGSTGKEWETWGIWYQKSRRREKRHTAPYLREGFTKCYLNEVSNLQINRHNSSGGHIWNRMHSFTCSFRRW